MIGRNRHQTSSARCVQLLQEEYDVDRDSQGEQLAEGQFPRKKQGTLFDFF